MVRRLVVIAFVIQICWLAGCSRGPKRPKKEPTFPVSGVVHIDGKPTAFVRVMLFPAGKEVQDPKLGSPHQANTDNDGKFKITTYDSGDGAPAGDYVLAFYWEGNPKVVPFQNQDEPQLDRDATRFNAKYGDPARSQHKVTVETGKSTEVGTLELTTK